MTGPLDIVGSLTAAVDAYTAAQDAMIAASKELAGTAPVQESQETVSQPEVTDGGIPA